jgi:hypothetical protein
MPCFFLNTEVQTVSTVVRHWTQSVAKSYFLSQFPPPHIIFQNYTFSSLCKLLFSAFKGGYKQLLSNYLFEFNSQYIRRTL